MNFCPRFIFLCLEKEEAAAAASDFFSHLHRLAHFPLLSKPQSLSLSIARSEMSGALASRAVAAAQRAAAPAVAPAKSSNGHRRRRRQLLPMPTATTRSMLQSPRRLAPFSDRCRPAESISALPYGDDDDDLTPDDVLGEKSTRDETLFFFRCRRRKKKKKKKTVPTASRRRSSRSNKLTAHATSSFLSI